MRTKTIGDRGEALAASYLEAKGYLIFERKYRWQRAEIDLVCFEPAADPARGGELVFVEVKTRTGIRFGRPEEAVTPEKQRQVVRAARAYLYEQHLENAPCRFDVLAVLLGGPEPQVEHFKNAFWAT